MTSPWRSFLKRSQLREFYTLHCFHIFGLISGGIWGPAGRCAHKRTQKHAFSQSFRHIWSSPPSALGSQQLPSEHLHPGLCKCLVSNYLLLFFGEEFGVNANVKVMPTARPVAASSRSCLGSAWSLKTLSFLHLLQENRTVLLLCLLDTEDTIMERSSPSSSGAPKHETPVVLGMFALSFFQI